MRTTSDPTRADVVSRRLELLRAEIARDWHEPTGEVAERVGEESAGESAGESVVGLGAEESVAVPEAVGGAWWSGHTRVAAPVPEALEPFREQAFGPPASPATAAPPVPVPGRHAARRAAVALVPEQVRGRVALGPWHLAVVALGVAVALAVACWWVVRGSSTSVPAPATVTAAPLVGLTPAPGATPVAVPSAPVSIEAGSSPASTATASTAEVTVDVEGKVRRPGVRVLPAGSRVIDAIRAAGGAPRRRDLSGLNLAAVLTDGQQIMVGAVSTTMPTVGPSAAATGAAGPGTLVDLNTATADELDTLPGVGPVTAQSILQWRAQNGGFTSIDELMSVDGIGPKTYAEIEPFVTV